MTKENAPSLLRRSLELSVFHDTTTIVRSFYISPSRGNDFCENERYIFLPFASIRFDWIRGNRGDRLIENKTEEGTRGSLTSRASLAMPPDCSP